MLTSRRSLPGREAQHQTLNRFSHSFLPRHHSKTSAGQRCVPAGKARGHLGTLAVKVQEWCFPHQGQDELSVKPVRSEGGDTSTIHGSLPTSSWASNPLCPRAEVKRELGRGSTGLSKIPHLSPHPAPCDWGCQQLPLKYPLP